MEAVKTARIAVFLRDYDRGEPALEIQAGAYLSCLLARWRHNLVSPRSMVGSQFHRPFVREHLKVSLEKLPVSEMANDFPLKF